MTNAEKYLKDETNINELASKMCEKYYEDTSTTIPLLLCTFFDEEAKPTLTEDERVILEFITNFDYIGRNEKGLYYKLQDEDIKERTAVIYNLTTNLFQFIKNGEEYSIEELLSGNV